MDQGQLIKNNKMSIMDPIDTIEKENEEVDHLIDTIYNNFGYDFRHYAPASRKRRIKNLLTKTKHNNISDLNRVILTDKNLLVSLLYNLSVTVTEMFRDPLVYKTIRQKVITILKSFPFINIWHAGCATGEEVYSMAILLKEENIYDRVRIYATDFNDSALEIAKEGVYPVDPIKLYTTNYQNAGGKNSFSEYYHSKYNSVMMNRDLKNNITFANHNLVTDKVFGEMHFIVCRNVLIYFDRELQDHVLNLFNDSLVNHGFLCLGTKETIKFSNIQNNFHEIAAKEKIYQKKVR